MAQERKIGVLVVDDEQVIRAILSDFFGAEGYKVFLACSAQEANNILAECRDQIDIIFLDLVMPDVSGLDFLREIRDKGIQIPVIIITAFKSVDTCRSAFLMGVADYLVKPFKVNDLLDLIKKILGKSAQ
jgi:DNA-binding NtrC family response regulator